MPTTREPTTCSNCRAGLRAGDRFCWTCGSPGTTSTTTTTTTTTAPDRLSISSDGRVERHDSPSSREVLRIVLPVASVLLVAAGVAVWWLLRPAPPVSTTTAEPPAASTSTSAPVTPTPTADAVVPTVAFPVGVLAGATATAPSTSADSADAGGRTTTYDAENLLDGDTTTAWRMEGDGTGAELTFTFDGPRRITEVGLVNGFAKVDPYDGTDRYDQGRRVLAATWSFDGQAPVSQQFLDDTRDLQLLPIAAVEATEITLTITDTSSAGAGGRFDRTAISEVQFSNR